MSIETLTTDEADEFVYGANIAMQDVSKHRWYTRKLVVFECDPWGLFGFYYMDPASELQEGQDRYESDPVKVFPVSAREVTTTVYEKAEAA